MGQQTPRGLRWCWAAGLWSALVVPVDGPADARQAAEERGQFDAELPRLRVDFPKSATPAS